MSDWLENPDEYEEKDDEYIAQLEEMDTGIILPTKYMSFSQINLYGNCGERYRRKYVLGNRSPASSNMAQGRLTHMSVEHMHLYKLNNKGEMPPKEYHHDIISDKLQEEFEEVQVWDDKTPDKETAEEFTRRLSDLYYENRLEDVRVRDAERKITGIIKDRIPFLGYIDLIEYAEHDSIDYDDPFVDHRAVKPSDGVRDLKTTGRKYGKNRIRNSFQLTLYADLLGVNDVGYDLLVQTKTGKTKYYKQRDIRSEGEKVHARDVVEDIAEAISAGVFPKTSPEHWMCSEKWCPFWDDCRGKHLQVSTNGIESQDDE